jgi:hypothetical protein
MKIAVMASFFAKWNMDINTGQFVCDLMNNLASTYLLSIKDRINSLEEIQTANIGACFFAAMYLFHGTVRLSADGKGC